MVNVLFKGFICSCLVAVLSGCAGYAGDVSRVRSSLLAGDKAGALEMVNESLEVKESDHYPVKTGGDNALLLLERGTVKQGLSQYEAATIDFQVADKNLELLDVKNDTAGNIGKWLFSDSVTKYKAPAHEKLLLNTLNMVNYLALGDLENARVEARRFSVMQQYLKDSKYSDEAKLPLGSYLAGFTFEMSKRYEQALQKYDEALRTGGFDSIAQPVSDLAGCTTFRTDRIDAVLSKNGKLLQTEKTDGPGSKKTPPFETLSADASQAQGAPGEPPPLPSNEQATSSGGVATASVSSTAPSTDGTKKSKSLADPAKIGSTCKLSNKKTGTILSISSVGLAPHKVAKRIPIGAALVIAAHVVHGPAMGMNDTQKANRLAAQGLLKWVMFPQLVRTKSKFNSVSVFVDQRPIVTEQAANIQNLVFNAWENVKGTFMVAAITRMITRAVAGGATTQAIKSGGGDSALGFLAGLLVEGALTAADTPDTRSWVTLPAHVMLSRTEVKPGKHTVSVVFSGARGKKTVTQTVFVPPGGFAVVNSAAMQ